MSIYPTRKGYGVGWREEFNRHTRKRELTAAGGTEMVVGLGRVELPTSPLSGVRSSHLSYRPAFLTVDSLRRTFATDQNPIQYRRRDEFAQ